MKWISVEERLPAPTKKLVLVFTSFGIELGTGYEIAFWEGVTHWMLLPEPPKGGDNG